VASGSKNGGVRARTKRGAANRTAGTDAQREERFDKRFGAWIDEMIVG
jgi:hypothetical protein